MGTAQPQLSSGILFQFLEKRGEFIVTAEGRDSTSGDVVKRLPDCGA